MTPNKQILSIDVGTSFVKSALIDADSRMRRLVRVPCPSRDLGGGRVEIDAEAVLRALDRAVSLTLPHGISPPPQGGGLGRGRGGGEGKGGVIGLSLATQRSTAVLWDPKSGRPVCPALSWQDSRTAPQVRKLARHEARVEQLTGLRLSPHYAAPKIAWMLDQKPGWRRRAEGGGLHAGTLSAFLLSRLLGRHLQDHTNGQRTLLLNIRTLDWDPFLVKIFRVPRACLGSLIPASGNLGRVRRWGLDLPLLSVLGDQQAALLAHSPSPLGEGRGKDTAALVNYGTGAFVLLPTGSRRVRKKGLLTTLLWTTEKKPSFPSPFLLRQAQDGEQRRTALPQGERVYALEGSVQAAGSLFPWAANALPLLGGGEGTRSIRRLDALCRQAAGRVTCVPSPSGLASPRWIPDLCASLKGLQHDTPPREIFRALSDSIAYSVQEILDAAGRAWKPSFLTVSGTLSASEFLVGTQANLAGTPVRRSSQSETTLLGSARMAWDVLGLAAPVPAKGKEFRPGGIETRAGVRSSFRAWRSVMDKAVREHRARLKKGKPLWPELGKHPILIGHRGYRSRYPENTLLSFREAYKAGARMIECDVQLSSDGVPVVMHDVSLHRTSDGRGKITNSSLKYLSQLDAGSWFDPRFSGEKIPTLDEVLRAVPPGRLIYVEIKAPERRPRLAGTSPLDTALFRLCDGAAEGVKRRKLEKRALVASFDPRVCRYLKLAHPELRTGFIYMSEDSRREAEGYGFQYVDVLCPRFNLVDGPLLAQARAGRRLVFSWTAKTSSEIRRLKRLGVEGIAVDDMELGKRA